MKLLSSFQLATLLADVSVATVQATDFFVFCICCAITWIRLMVKSRPNMNKMAILMRSLIELVHS